MEMDIGLLLIRAALGFAMFYHGAQKLFGWFGGMGLKGTAGIMESMGFVPGGRNAFMAGLTEGLGGLLLFLGLLTSLGSMLVFSVMLVAALAVHFKNGFNIVKGGFEYNFILACTGLALAFTGPGSYSLDAVLGLHFSGVEFGVGAFALAVVGAAGQLMLRKAPAAAPPAH